MNEEQLLIVQRVLDHVFGEGRPSEASYKARLDKDSESIVVDAWTISRSEVEVASIMPDLHVPGYVLEVAVPTAGNWDEPPGMDVCEVMTDRSLPAVIEVLMNRIAMMRAGVVLEAMATDAWVADMERDEREAKEYFAIASREQVKVDPRLGNFEE